MDLSDVLNSFILFYKMRLRELQKFFMPRQNTVIGIVADISENHITLAHDTLYKTFFIKDTLMRPPVGAVVQACVSNNNTITEILLPGCVPVEIPRVDCTVALASDIHCGNKNFLEKPFRKFLQFVADNKIDVLIIAGDTVEGVGVFPAQRDHLTLFSYEDQYNYLAELLAEVPPETQIYMIPGDHDLAPAVLPQPPPPERVCRKLRSLGNVSFLPNPAVVWLHGVQILTYHPLTVRSFASPITTTMRLMLEMRHLSPEPRDVVPVVPDPLIIRGTPHIFHCGHSHIHAVETYKNVFLVSTGAFITPTDYQREKNITPSVATVEIIKLKEGTSKTMCFNNTS